MSVRPFFSTNFLCGNWMFEPRSGFGAALAIEILRARTVKKKIWRMTVIPSFPNKCQTIPAPRKQVHCEIFGEAPSICHTALAGEKICRFQISSSTALRSLVFPRQLAIKRGHADAEQFGRLLFVAGGLG